MIWLTWRQQRLESALAATALALAAALLVPLGLHIASVYHSSGVAACLAQPASEHYLAPLKRIWTPGTPGPTNLNHAWSLQSGPTDRSGHVVANAQQIFSVCTSGPKAQAMACFRSHGIFNYALYQPASRFWVFQGIESAIFVGLALVLATAAVWWVRKRLA